MIFVALRLGDLINAFIGLWLVPKYVPQDELGAVLPLVQAASFLGVPMGVAVVVLTKFLNQYKTKGEDGKVKSLLLSFWGVAAVITILSIVFSVLFLPGFFDRIRVADGSLSVLIVASCLVGAVCPMFNNALQGLKKFKTITLINLFSAPVRLVTMLVAMPIRALSGYMLGQVSVPIFQMVVSCFTLRKEIGHGVKSVPFWRDDGRKILKYAGMIALSYVGGSVLALVQPMIIRQRLPEIDSAAYYVISRFAELSTYAGQTLMFMIFPFAVEAHTRGKESMGILYRSAGAVAVFGCMLAIAMYFAGDLLLGLNSLWGEYVKYTTDMSLIAFTLTIGIVSGVFVTYEGANERFSYLWYNIPLCLLQAVFLVCFFGYGFFRGIVPDSWMEWMDAANVLNLHCYVWINLIFAFLGFMFICGHLLLRRLRQERNLTVRSE